MLDTHLCHMVDWRYCNIRNLDKVPLDNGWQKKPLTLEQVHTDNIGLILGTYSNGICAIDFDGIEAIDHWTDTFGLDISTLDTVMWTSGKDYRCQAAFTVDSEYWDILKRKVVNKLEFRWNGCQSILPPSKLSDGRQYVYINSPSTHIVQRLPDIVLEYWLQLIYLDLQDIPIQNIQHTVTQYDEKFIDELLSKIQPKVGNLRGNYDVWRTIAWAVCSQVGTITAKQLLMYHWPEKTKKELKTLNSWKPSVRGPGIGTLIKMSGISTAELRVKEFESQLRMKYK